MSLKLKVEIDKKRLVEDAENYVRENFTDITQEEGDKEFSKWIIDNVSKYTKLSGPVDVDIQ